MRIDRPSDLWRAWRERSYLRLIIAGCPDRLAAWRCPDDVKTLAWLRSATQDQIIRCAFEGHQWRDVPGLGITCVACGKEWGEE